MQSTYRLARTHVLEAFRNGIIWMQTLMEQTPSFQGSFEKSNSALQSSSCSTQSHTTQSFRVAEPTLCLTPDEIKRQELAQEIEKLRRIIDPRDCQRLSTSLSL